MLKNMCVSGFFDAETEPYSIWHTANRVMIERTFQAKPRLVKFEYVGPAQHNVE